MILYCRGQVHNALCSYYTWMAVTPNVGTLTYMKAFVNTNKMTSVNVAMLIQTEINFSLLICTPSSVAGVL